VAAKNNRMGSATPKNKKCTESQGEALTFGHKKRGLCPSFGHPSAIGVEALRGRVLYKKHLVESIGCYPRPKQSFHE
jgi:hypothetical protein